MAIAAVIIRLLLSVIFFRAAWHKLKHRQEFQAELDAYQLLPGSWLFIVAPSLILIEAISACSLLYLHWAAGLYLAAVLLCVYAIAMAINLLKGRTSIDCGCGGVLFSYREAAKKTISWSLVLRNLLLALAALFFTLTSVTIAFAALDVFFILVGAIVMLLVYEAAEQALANSQRYRLWLAQQTVKT